MSLVGPWLTTTSTKKRTEKVTKAKQEELERGWRDRNKWLKEMGLPKQSFEEYKDWIYGRGKKTTSENRVKATSSASRKPTNLHAPVPFSGPASSRTTDNKKYKSLAETKLGPCSSKPTQMYTGENVLGIAVLHKSCLQPIFSQEEATNVARMRR